MADTDVVKPQVPEHQLQADGITAAGSIVMAVAGSAPAYSIAATTATLVAVAGLASPAALLWCGLPMLGIAWAFSYLGRADVNAGASYSWVGRALHPILGFFSGWALVVSATIFMVAGALPAGVMTVALFSPENMGNVPLVTGIGAVWFLIMATCVLVGVRITARAQWIMSSIEVAILVVFAIAAIVHAIVSSHAGPDFSWSWLGFSHFTGTGAFVAAALIAAFYYWGWDVASNLNEETKNGRKASGKGGIIGVIIVFVLFEVFTIATLVILPTKTIDANSGNVLGVLGEAIWPGIGGKILIIAVMLSTIATLETTLIQVTRTLFAMGRDHTIPERFGHAHPKWRTPAFATLVVTGVSVVLFIGSNFLGTVGDILSNAISSIGLQIAFYYALAGIAVVVAYRKVIFTSVKNFIFIGLWPALGALFMVWIFIVSIPSLETIVVIIGIGALALGIIPLVLFWKKGAAYFQRRPLELPDELDAVSPENIDLDAPR
ncbi:APC family permease [Glaciibacter psychrotolerans]|uniref:Amino acid transporter n=1 Tax=Glaciibacter psychrotolerans TaxID=670054 RepID=A0A7Z0J558_9MICO|nr:APC family permease [Leifsonia psychrotolerans]NYJ19102.1 amino acid transporter [Leifsonia psychrotolerans]